MTQPTPSQRTKTAPAETISIQLVFSVALIAGVLAFLVGLAAANVYFRVVTFDSSTIVTRLFDPSRDLTTINRLIAQYAFCNVLNWLMETGAISYIGLPGITALSLALTTFLGMLALPRSGWTTSFSSKFAVLTASVHAILVIATLLIWSTVLGNEFTAFESLMSSRSGTGFYRGELFGWFPIAAGVTFFWNMAIASCVGGIFGWLFESIDLYLKHQSSSS